MLPSPWLSLSVPPCCHPHGDAAIVLAVAILARNVVRGMSCAKQDIVRGMSCAKRDTLRGMSCEKRDILREMSCAKRDIVRETRYCARNETPCAKSHIVRETRYLARNEVSCAKKHTSKPFIFQKFCLILRPVSTKALCGSVEALLLIFCNDLEIP